MTEDKISVYDGRQVVARVKYNENLDHWDGHNWTCGGLGLHEGITRLKDGRFVIIRGSQHEGDRDYAEIVSNDMALQAVLRAKDEKLLQKYFSEKIAELDTEEEE